VTGRDALAATIRTGPRRRRVTGRWTAGDLSTLIDTQAARLRGRGLWQGEPVGLALANGDDWILALLALLEAGAQPLLIAADAPPAERQRVLELAGAGRHVEAVGPGELDLRGEPVGRSRSGGTSSGTSRGVLLLSSGSTGAPKIVRRPEESLLAEADRYVATLSLDGTGRLVLPLPLHHAYALGWLAAALRCGVRVSAMPPTDLNAIGAELRDGATMIALVPTLARLVAMRQLRQRYAHRAPALRIAMVGAGPVDATLEELFQQAFGVSTARNYGSTETGAVFAGTAPQPPLCVGAPMTGVEFRVVGEDGRPCPDGTAGTLLVRPDSRSPWHDTQDLVVFEQGRLAVLGRKHRAIRRGGQWVSPLEVEAVLRKHPQVLDASVSSRKGRHEGEDILVADVEVSDPRNVDAASLSTFARAQLAPPSVPQEFGIHARLPRGHSGKVLAPRRYVAADAETLLGAARAYRRAELLFALRDSGLLGMVDQPSTAAELAMSLDLPVREVDWVLSIAAALGLVVEATDLVVEATDDAQPSPSDEVTPLLRLESLLSRGWLGRDAIMAALRQGIADRPFERSALDPELVTAYAEAMNNAAAQQRAVLGVRLTRHLPRDHVLEVSAGPGRYLARLLSTDREATGCLVQLGRLAGPVDPVVLEGVRQGRIKLTDNPPRGAFDLCVVANGIHGPAPGGDLPWLLDRLQDCGALLIDDVFLPPLDGGSGSEIGLDWLTHGGIAWPRVDQLAAEIRALGREVVLNRRFGSFQCHLILATGGGNA
jgi:long-chain acyl-CoA synthetase